MASRADNTEPTRGGVSPIGTYSPNSGATAATNSSYAQGAYTSGIAVLDVSVTTYILNDTDYQGIVVFNTNSAVTATLNSAVKPNFQATILNVGTGAITITTSDGSLINGGGASLTGGSKQGFQVFFSQQAWTAYAGTTILQTVPANTPGVAHQFFTAYNSTTGVFSLAQPAFTDISGVASAAQLPSPTVSTLGGVEAVVAVTHEWINAITTSGVPQLSQPAFTDVSGNLATAQLPVAGVSGTITLAALTGLGTQGSITLTNGIVTAFTNPT